MLLPLVGKLDMLIVLGEDAPNVVVIKIVVHSEHSIWMVSLLLANEIMQRPKSSHRVHSWQNVTS